MNDLRVKDRIRGMTLLEVLVAIAIIGLLSALVLVSFSTLRSRETLDASVERVLAAFSEAHLDTISSKNDTSYGVYLKSDEVIYFTGSSYPGDSDPGNIIFLLPTTIEIANVSLNGGGNAVYYKRLTGATDEYGTFDIEVKGNPSVKTTVTITPVGATSI